MKRLISAVVAVVCLTGLTQQVRGDEAATNATPSAAAQEAMTPPAPAAGTEMNAFASSAGYDPDKWNFTMPLYIWAINLTGTTTLKGNNLTVDQSFTELMDHMDQGITAYLQFSKPQYGFYVNPNYYALTFNGKVSGVKGDLGLDLLMIEMGGYYRIWDYKGDRPAQLSVVGGARYWNLHENLHIKFPIGTPNDKSVADTQWLLDPFIGLRFNEAITPRLHVMAQTDVGGFNIDEHTSRFSWQLMALLGYDFTMPLIKRPSTVFGGWRQINVQKTSGSNTTDQNAINLNFSGVMVGLNVSLF